MRLPRGQPLVHDAGHSPGRDRVAAGLPHQHHPLKHAEQFLRLQSCSDSLTGLSNRTAILDALDLALAAHGGSTQRHVGVVFIDLDGFKPINDTLGHAVGDELLQVIASRLQQVARPQDTVGRLGGDEFVVVAPMIDDAGLRRLVARVGAVFEQTSCLGGLEIGVAASVGGYLAATGESADDALDRADQAMYADKRSRDARHITVRPRRPIESLRPQPATGGW